MVVADLPVAGLGVIWIVAVPDDAWFNAPVVLSIWVVLAAICGLYLLGLGGVRIEDTGMVTKDGFRNFTTLTRSLDPRDYL